MSGDYIGVMVRNQERERHRFFSEMHDLRLAGNGTVPPRPSLIQRARVLAESLVHRGLSR